MDIIELLLLLPTLVLGALWLTWNWLWSLIGW